MARKQGILSDAYYLNECVENQPLKVGIAQKLFPYKQSSLAGVPLPKEIPVAQRGYQLNRVAIDLAKLTNRSYESIVNMLKQEQLQTELDRVRLTPTITQSMQQASSLAYSYTPFEPIAKQLKRPITLFSGAPSEDLRSESPRSVIPQLPQDKRM